MFSQFGGGYTPVEQYHTSAGNAYNQYDNQQNTQYAVQQNMQPTQQPAMEATVQTVMNSLNRYKTVAANQTVSAGYHTAVSHGNLAPQYPVPTSQYVQAGVHYSETIETLPAPQSDDQMYWRFCQLCNIRFTNVEHYDAHCAGDLHKRNVKKISRGAALHGLQHAAMQQRPAVPQQQQARPGVTAQQPRMALGIQIARPQTSQQPQLRGQLNTQLWRGQTAQQFIGPIKPGAAVAQESEQTHFTCKVCEEGEVFDTSPEWVAHIESRQHCEMLLRSYYRLGLQKFLELYGGVPFSPKLDAQCSQEEAAEIDVHMRIRSGLLNNFMCKLCVTKLSTKNNWTEHVTGRRHNRRCVETMNVLGRQRYFEQYGDVPQPNTEKIKQTLQLIKEEAEKEVLAKEQNAKIENAYTYCKACDERLVTETDWMVHIESVKHCKTLLSFFYSLGVVRYEQRFSSIPFGGFLDSQCMKEDRVDIQAFMRMRSGILNSFKCRLCATKCTVKKNWNEHMAGKKHNKKCLETLNSMGLETYVQQFGDIPIPHGGKLLETLGAILRESGDSPEGKKLVENVRNMLLQPGPAQPQYPDARGVHVQQYRPQVPLNEPPPQVQPQMPGSYGRHLVTANQIPRMQVPISQLQPVLLQPVSGATVVQGPPLQYLVSTPHGPQAVVGQLAPQNIMIPANQQVAEVRGGDQPAIRNRIPTSISVPPSANPEFLRNQLQKQLLGIPATSEAEVYDYAHSRSGKPDQQDVEAALNERYRPQTGDKFSNFRNQTGYARENFRDNRPPENRRPPPSHDPYMEPRRRTNDTSYRTRGNERGRYETNRRHNYPTEKSDANYDPEWDASNYKPKDVPKKEENKLDAPARSERGSSWDASSYAKNEENKNIEKEKPATTNDEESKTNLTHDVSKRSVDSEMKSPPVGRNIDNKTDNRNTGKESERSGTRTNDSYTQAGHWDRRSHSQGPRQSVSRDTCDNRPLDGRHMSKDRYQSNAETGRSRDQRDRGADRTTDQRGRAPDRTGYRELDRRRDDRHSVHRHRGEPRRYEDSDSRTDHRRPYSDDRQRARSGHDGRGRRRTPPQYNEDRHRSFDRSYQSRDRSRDKYLEPRDHRERSHLSSHRRSTERGASSHRREPERDPIEVRHEQRKRDDRDLALKTLKELDRQERGDSRNREQTYSREREIHEPHPRSEERYHNVEQQDRYVDLDRHARSERADTRHRSEYDRSERDHYNEQFEKERYPDREYRDRIEKERYNERDRYDERTERERYERPEKERYNEQSGRNRYNERGQERNSETGRYSEHREGRYEHSERERYHEHSDRERRYEHPEREHYNERAERKHYHERPERERYNEHDEREHYNERTEREPYSERKHPEEPYERNRYLEPRNYDERTERDHYEQRSHRENSVEHERARYERRERQRAQYEPRDERRPFEEKYEQVDRYERDREPNEHEHYRERETRHVSYTDERFGQCDEKEPRVRSCDRNEPKDLREILRERKQHMDPDDLRYKLQHNRSEAGSYADDRRVVMDFEDEPIVIEVEPSDYDYRRVTVPSGDEDLRMQLRRRRSMDERRDFDPDTDGPRQDSDDRRHWDRYPRTYDGREYNRGEPRTYEETDRGPIYDGRELSPRYEQYLEGEQRYEEPVDNRRRRYEERPFGEAEKRAKDGMLKREAKEGYIPGANWHGTKKQRLSEEEPEEHIDRFCRTMQQFLTMLYNPQARVDGGKSDDQTSLTEQEEEMVRQVRAMTGVEDDVMAAKAVKVLSSLDSTIVAALSSLDPDVVQELVNGNHRALMELPTFDDIVESIENGRISISALSQTLNEHGFVYNPKWRGPGGAPRGRGHGTNTGRGRGVFRGRGRSRGRGRGKPQ